MSSVYWSLLKIDMLGDTVQNCIDFSENQK